MNAKNGIFEIVTGKNEREQHVFSVIVKRSYLITDTGKLERRITDHELRKIDSYYENGDPDWSVVQCEYELAPCKPLVDSATGFAQRLASFGSRHHEIPGHLVAFFMPASANNENAFVAWLARTLAADLPDGLHLVAIDSIESPRLNLLISSRNPL